MMMGVPIYITFTSLVLLVFLFTGDRNADICSVWGGGFGRDDISIQVVFFGPDPNMIEDLE